MTRPRDIPAWIPGARFEEALLYTVRTHALQARKGGKVPYLAHLFGVASLVMEDGGSEDETIAALLHDAAEDQGGEARLRDIKERFGPKVAKIVLGCSDTLETPKPKWPERKARYLKHLPSVGAAAQRVSLADKLHNARAMAADYAKVREKLWKRFNAGRGEQEWYYRGLCKVLARTEVKTSPMLRQLKNAVKELFG